MDLSSDDIRDYMKCMNLIEKANAEKVRRFIIPSAVSRLVERVLKE